MDPVLLEKLRDTFVSLVTKELMKRLVARFAFLAFPVIGPIASLVIGKLVKELAEVLELLGYSIYVDKVTAKQAEKFNEAAIAHEAAKKSGDKDAIAAAEKARIDAARDLIKWNKL